MALSPGIPTSFVPKQPVQTSRRKMSSGNNIFLLVSLGVFGLAALAAAGIFAYDQILKHVETAKAAELKQKQDAVDASTVKDYIRLKNRFASGAMILNNHLLLSRFFDELEKSTLQNVQFNSLNLTVAGDGSAKVELVGTAKNYNALAVEDNTIAKDSNFMQGIFSGIGIDDKNRIKFTLDANVSKDLIHVTQKQSQALPITAVAAPAPAFGTTTATTTP